MKKIIILFTLSISIITIMFTVLFLSKKDNGKLTKTNTETPKNIKTLKLTKKIQGSIQKAKNIILDIDNYKNFMPNIKKSLIFDKKDNCLFTYTQMNAPIISDRDYVLKLCVEKDDKNEVIITWKTIKNKKYPPNKDFVRITQNTGSWRIKKTDDKNIEVTYSLSIDPKTNLPDFMLDKANKKTMNNIISALENRIKDKN